MPLTCGTAIGPRLAETGAGAALPPWLAFMQAAVGAHAVTDGAGLFGGERDAFADHRDVFFQPDAQGDFAVKVPGLANQADHVGGAIVGTYGSQLALALIGGWAGIQIPTGALAGAAILCLSFLGFDAVSTLSEEARDAVHMSSDLDRTTEVREVLRAVRAEADRKSVV